MVVLNDTTGWFSKTGHMTCRLSALALCWMLNLCLLVKRYWLVSYSRLLNIHFLILIHTFRPDSASQGDHVKLCRRSNTQGQDGNQQCHLLPTLSCQGSINLVIKAMITCCYLTTTTKTFFFLDTMQEIFIQNVCSQCSVTVVRRMSQ